MYQHKTPKTPGRYVEGEKFFAAHCPACRVEVYLTEEEARAFVATAYVAPRSGLRRLFGRGRGA